MKNPTKRKVAIGILTFWICLILSPLVIIIVQTPLVGAVCFAGISLVVSASWAMYYLTFEEDDEGL